MPDGRLPLGESLALARVALAGRARGDFDSTCRRQAAPVPASTPRPSRAWHPVPPGGARAGRCRPRWRRSSPRPGHARPAQRTGGGEASTIRATAQREWFDRGQPRTALRAPVRHRPGRDERRRRARQPRLRAASRVALLRARPLRPTIAARACRTGRGRGPDRTTAIGVCSQSRAARVRQHASSRRAGSRSRSRPRSRSCATRTSRRSSAHARCRTRSLAHPRHERARRQRLHRRRASRPEGARAGSRRRCRGSRTRRRASP